MQNTLPNWRLGFKSTWSLKFLTSWMHYRSLHSSIHLRWLCDNKTVHEASIVWLDSFFLEKTAAPALTTHLSLSSGSLYCSIQKEMLKFHVKAMNHFLGTYATDRAVVVADTEIVRLTQPTNMSPIQYTNVLWMNTLRGLQVQNEYVLKRTFVGGLLSSIKDSGTLFAALLSILH